MILEVIFPLIFGAVFIFAGITQKKKWKYLFKNGIKVKGIVYKLHGEFPVVRFTTLEKEWITKELRNGTGLEWLNEGDEIEVIYNPNNPEEVEIYQPNSLNFLIIFFIIFGTGWFIYGYINFLEYI